MNIQVNRRMYKISTRPKRSTCFTHDDPLQLLFQAQQSYIDRLYSEEAYIYILLIFPQTLSERSARCATCCQLGEATQF